MRKVSRPLAASWHDVFVEHTSEAPDATGTVRQRVKELRGRRGWTAAELGSRLSKLGVPWDRSIVANFENGRRRAVSVQELIGLALVFDVAPVNLLVPLNDGPVQLTPTRAEPAIDVREWFRGSVPLPGIDARTFLTEVSMADLEGRRPELADLRSSLMADPENPDDVSRSAPLMTFSRVKDTDS